MGGLGIVNRCFDGNHDDRDDYNGDDREDYEKDSDDQQIVFQGCRLEQNKPVCFCHEGFTFVQVANIIITIIIVVVVAVIVLSASFCCKMFLPYPPPLPA